MHKLFGGYLCDDDKSNNIHITHYGRGGIFAMFNSVRIAFSTNRIQHQKTKNKTYTHRQVLRSFDRDLTKCLR